MDLNNVLASSENGPRSKRARVVDEQVLEENKLLKLEVATLTLNIDELKLHLDDETEALSLKKREIKALRNDMELGANSNEKAKRKFAHQIQMKNKKIRQLTARIAKKDAEILHVQSKLNILTAENQVIRSALASVESQSFDNKLAALEAELATRIEVERAEHSSFLQFEKQKNELLVNENARLASDLKESQTRLKGLQDQFASKIDEYELSLSSLEKSSSGIMTDIMSYNQSLLNECSYLKKELKNSSAKQKEAESHSTLVYDLKANQILLEKKLKQVEKHRDEQTKELDGMAKEKAEYRNLYETEKSGFETYRMNFTTKYSEYESKTDLLIDALKAEVETLSKSELALQNKNLRDKVSKLKSELKDKQIRFDSLYAQMRDFGIGSESAD